MIQITGRRIYLPIRGKKSEIHARLHNSAERQDVAALRPVVLRGTKSAC